MAILHKLYGLYLVVFTFPCLPLPSIQPTGRPFPAFFVTRHKHTGGNLAVCRLTAYLRQL